MSLDAHHGSMFQIAALVQAADITRRSMEGWGPPGADPREPSAAPRRRPYVARAPRSSRAVRAVFSAVIPSFSRTSAPGALAPKRSIDTVRSTQRSHP
jgi:hypothetical protein